MDDFSFRYFYLYVVFFFNSLGSIKAISFFRLPNNKEKEDDEWRKEPLERNTAVDTGWEYGSKKKEGIRMP